MRSTSMSSRALPEWGPHREAWWGCTERRSARRLPRGMVGLHREALGTALASGDRTERHGGAAPRGARHGARHSLSAPEV